MKTRTFINHFLNRSDKNVEAFEIIENESISGQVFKDLCISGALLKNNELNNVTFENCEFFGSKLENCNMRKVCFKNCKFNFSGIKNCQFVYTQFEGVTCISTPIEDSKLDFCFMDSKSAHFLDSDSNLLNQCQLSLTKN